jgi:hypothetical protein
MSKSLETTKKPGERIKKIKELDYKTISAIDLGDNGIRIQEIWCHD